MRASGSGFFGVVLMLAPLCVIPVLAIVGIPQFAPILSPQSDTTIAAEIQDSEPFPVETDWGDSPRYQSDSLFAPLNSDSSAEQFAETADQFDHQSRNEIFSDRSHDDVGARDFGRTAPPLSRDDRMVSASPWDPPATALDGWEIEQSHQNPGAPRQDSVSQGGLSEASRRRLMESRGGFGDPRSTPAGQHRSAEQNPFALEHRNQEPDASANELFADLSQGDGSQMDAPLRSPPPSNENLRNAPPEIDDSQIDLFSSLRNSKGSSNDSIAKDAPEFSGTSRDPNRVNDPASESLQAILTWRTASQRLRALGVQHHDFDYDATTEQFHFHCELTPADNPAVTQSFEADAGEPLVAVQEVLDQIATWQRERPRRTTSIGRSQVPAAPTRFEW